MPVSTTFDEARQRLIESLKPRSAAPAGKPRTKSSKAEKPAKAAAKKTSSAPKKRS